MTRFGRVRVDVAYAIILAGPLILPAAARAACDTNVGQVQIPQIPVINNSVEYTRVDGLAFFWTATIDIVCGVFGRVKDYTMSPAVNVQGVGQTTIAPAVSKSYSFGSRPKEIHSTHTQQFASTEIEPLAVSACNRHAVLLRAGGMSNNEIFSMQHVIALEHRILANSGYSNTAEVGHVGLFGPGFSEILCRPFGGPEIETPEDLELDDGDPPFDVSLGIDLRFTAESCDAGTRFTAKVLADRPRDAILRLESTAGWRSDAGALTEFEYSKDDGAWVAELRETLDIKALPTVQIGSASEGDEYTRGILKDSGLFPSSSDISPSDLKGLRSGELRTGAMRLVAETRDGSFSAASPWVNYRYACAAQEEPNAQ